MGPAGKKLHILKNLLNGSIKVCEFGITNCCTCKCSFCGIWKQQKKVMVDYTRAFKAIDILASFGVSHITLTGGEPLLHPQIVKIAEHCRRRNIHCAVLNADARLVTDMKIKLLSQAGVDLICISIDSDDPKIVEESRKVPDLMRHIENAVKLTKKYRVKTMASIVIWKGNYNRLRQLMDKIESIGFDQTAINYPEISESSVYPLGGEGVDLTREQIIRSLKDIIELKKEGYQIMNIPSSLRNIIAYLQHPDKVKYYCYGGSRVFFLDWHFDLYPCMHLADPIGSIWKIKEKNLNREKCNSCNMSWYRDFSVYFHGIKSVQPLYETARQLYMLK